jgi:hypothetical protein
LVTARISIFPNEEKKTKGKRTQKSQEVREKVVRITLSKKDLMTQSK